MHFWDSHIIVKDLFLLPLLHANYKINKSFFLFPCFYYLYVFNVEQEYLALSAESAAVFQPVNLGFTEDSNIKGVYCVPFIRCNSHCI